MSRSGDVHVSVGRKARSHDGRPLGLGKDEELCSVSTEGFLVKSVAAGTNVLFARPTWVWGPIYIIIIIYRTAGGSFSFAVTEDGLAYAWGLQLGSENEGDQQWVPNKVTGKQLEGRKLIDASVSRQHSALLVTYIE